MSVSCLNAKRLSGTFVYCSCSAVERTNLEKRMPEKTNLVYVIPSSTWKIPLLPNPVSFGLHLKPTLNHRISSQLCQPALSKLVDLFLEAIGSRTSK
jgi:hypothetical protein